MSTIPESYLVCYEHIQALSKQTLGDGDWGAVVRMSDLFSAQNIGPILRYLRLHNPSCVTLLERVMKHDRKDLSEDKSEIILCGIENPRTQARPGGVRGEDGYLHVIKNVDDVQFYCDKEYLVNSEMMDAFFEAFVVAGIPIRNIKGQSYFVYDD